MAGRMRTQRQTSAGGVVFRRRHEEVAVALIRVGEPGRWQLPKGIVEAGEAPEATAMREVREEAGVAAALTAPIEVVEYWYVGTERSGERVRFHKFVHFFLLEYESGDLDDHDHEVEEARWVPLGEAEAMLAFASERRVMRHAQALLSSSS